MTEFKIVAALSENYVIGGENGIPWNIPEDIEHFRSTVSGEVVICGRVTFEGAGEMGSHTVVLSRNEDIEYDSNDVHLANSIDEAKNKSEELSSNGVVYIAGGESVYEGFLDTADEMILSHVHQKVDGDTEFPRFDKSNWTVTETKPREEFTIKYYDRT
jgi:dihydrofolate reductase